MKKPKSQVKGDIDPRLVTKYADLLAIPVHAIFEKTFCLQEWPQLWATETVTLIPKVPKPDSLSQMRNISCTPLFSKCLENFLLAGLKGRVRLSDNQFGGLKGVGVDHYLVDTWNDIMAGLEEPGACVNLMSIDFQKAFNTMCHWNCLESMLRLGATDEQALMVASFLRNRVMRVKIGDKLSQPRLVPGGAPQGSVLGSFLFCAATNVFGEDLGQVPRLNTSCDFSDNGVNVSHTSDPEIESPPSPIAPPLEDPVDPDEIVSDESEDEFRVFRPGPRRQRITDDSSDSLSFRWAASQLNAELGLPAGWNDPGLAVKVYIDDVNNVEKINISNAVSRTWQGRRQILAHAQACERNFKAVREEAGRISMTVNDSKTQLLCISGNLDNDISTYIRPDETTEIVSGRELKLLGFWFGTRPNANLHVQKMAAKFRSRLWALRHLKNAGMNEDDLKKIYQTVILPVIDFACPTYHPLLTRTQSEQIEALQKRASKIIFGYNASYKEVISSGRLQLLEERRKTLCINFAKKASADERFATKWFPQKPVSVHNTRNPETYLVSRPRTERMKKNPVTYMRTELNRLTVV